MFSEKLRQLREERHWTQEQAATQIGITTRNYQDLEGGKLPKYETLLSISDVYGVSIDWLVGRSSHRDVRP